MKKTDQELSNSVDAIQRCMGFMIECEERGSFNTIELAAALLDLAKAGVTELDVSWFTGEAEEEPPKQEAAAPLQLQHCPDDQDLGHWLMFGDGSDEDDTEWARSKRYEDQEVWANVQYG